MNITNILENIEFCIFDFDGVIADTEPLHFESYVESLKEYEIYLTKEDYLKYIGKSDTEIFNKISKEFDKKLDIKIIRDKRNKIFLELINKTQLMPNKAILPILESCLKKSIPNVILSSQNSNIIAFILEEWQVSKFFVHIHSADTEHPKHVLIDDICNDNHVSKSKTALFEDNVSTLYKERESGMRTIGISHTLNSISESDADFIIPIE